MLWSIHDITPPYGTAPVARPSPERTAVIMKAFARMAEDTQPRFESSAFKIASARGAARRAFLLDAVSTGKIFTKKP